MRVFVIILITAISAAAYTIDVDIDSLSFGEVELANKGSFDSVWIEGEMTLPVETGSPALPGYAVSVALPQGTVIETVNVTYAEPTELPGSYDIMPMQEMQPIGTDPEYSAPNEAVYSSDAAFPGELVFAHNSGNRSGYHVGNIVFAPVQYVPATGKITVYSSISFDVTLTSPEGDLVYPEVRMQWIDERIRRDIENSVINPGEVNAPAGMEVLVGYDLDKDDVVPYLIITARPDATDLDSLAEWKTRKGNRAEIKTVDDITTEYPGTDTEEKIRNCIIDYYSTKGTQYVVLVGQHTNLPMRYCYDSGFNVMENNNLVPTDDYYACLDGNWNADNDTYWGEHPDDNVDFDFDVYVGRFQAHNDELVANIVNKTLCYEGTSLSDATNPYDYCGEALLAGAWLDSNTNTGECMDFIADNYLTDAFWTNEILQDPTYSGSTFSGTRFISEMEEGRDLIAHSAHSNTTILGTNSGSVNSAQLEALDNGPRFTGCLYSLGCYQGKVESNANCAASFVRNDDGGGAGYIGNTRYGWYSPGNPHGASAAFLEEYFNQIGVEGKCGSGEAYVEHLNEFSGGVGNDYTRYIFYELYLTGDPDLVFNNAEVSPPEVTYDDNIPQGDYSYLINVVKEGKANPGVEGAMVCLWKGDEVYDCGVTDINGDISFDISPTSQGTMYLTVTAQNYETFEADITVTDETGIDLAYFGGRQTKKGVELEWETVNEGEEDYTFNLYRRDITVVSSLGDMDSGLATESAAFNDSWIKINVQPIRGDNPYSYLDTGVSEGEYEYRLEAVSDSGAEVMGTAGVNVNQPQVYALYQSRPNPAIGRAIIGFSLAEAGHTTLEVFDISGRKIMTLADETLPAGEYSREIANVASGVYLYRLSSNDFVATKKMIVK
ncbi:MAG: T9SS type A sorting domain-containing protein [bacterium]|nr:T9SS type A sorting domain-containing protein [bacterium]